jgi:hypothetical protein
MKRHFYLIALALFCMLNTANASIGDTTWVQGFHGEFTQYGNFDTAVTFPSGSVTYRKIYMILTLGEYNCVAGSQYCHQWDYDVENYVMTPAGDTLELARFITPYATAGTPGFGAAWKQHYIFDVTDYYTVLKNAATMRIVYSGYSWGFSGDVKFAFIEGMPERNVLGYTKLWNSTYTYGNIADPIDNHLLPDTLIPPAGTQSSELKFAITGHGYDNTSGCCEFDKTYAGHTYSVLANNNIVAQYNMNVTCGESEIYPQGGTWAYGRAGNWCPGGSVQAAQYKLNGLVAGMPNTVDVNFDDTYNGGGAYGIYKIAGTAFYYAGYNKITDASIEDIVAPTNFEWYKRENPRTSIPVIKVRNTGADTVHTILFEYGISGAPLTQYIWVGTLIPSQVSSISLAPLIDLTNLSLNYNTGNFSFIVDIVQVNGQSDNDQSNDTLTSTFSVAPTWPSSFLVKMKTNSWGTNSLGSNPSAASWQLTDLYNNVLASRTNNAINTLYNDTVTLNTQSFYALTVSTTNCTGLSWWADAQNYGSSYVAGTFSVLDYNNGNAVLPLNGDYTGAYHDDFGCGFTQYFTTGGQCQAGAPTITRTGNILTSSQGVRYQWYVNGALIPGAIDSSYTLTQKNKNYSVQVTDGNGCIGISSVKAVTALSSVNTGLSNISDPAAMSVSPNPVRNAFTLYVNNEFMGAAYTISDLTGREILSGEINTQTTNISVVNISGGIYLVTVTDGKNAITKRLAIAR